MFKNKLRNSSNKTGVLLINLGTPKQPTKKSLSRYLAEFLSDDRIIEPKSKLLWKIVLYCFILKVIQKKSAKKYQKIWSKFGDGSPLLDISIQQTKLIASKLNDDFIVNLAMRYGSPSIANELYDLQKQDCNKIIIFPLYPQYSSATTGSAFDAIARELQTWRNIPQLLFINHYFDNPNYINALAKSVRDFWDKFGKSENLIISYHGIPQRFSDGGDLYTKQCEKSSQLLAAALGLEDWEYSHCYQSNFGREQWVKPYIKATLKNLVKASIKNVQIICPGFSADCVETLEEICIENKNYFIDAGGEKYQYIPALNTNEDHIKFLVDIINN